MQVAPNRPQGANMWFCNFYLWHPKRSAATVDPIHRLWSSSYSTNLCQIPAKLLTFFAITV